MGTNYYLETECCPTCKRPRERLHIGKSSAGWCFALHVDSEYASLEDWRQAWSQPNARIVDEYDSEVDADEMIRIITVREWKARELDESWYRMNHAEPGPNNLARHTIGRHCLGHGEGTYDLVPGEFS